MKSSRINLPIRFVIGFQEWFLKANSESELTTFMRKDDKDKIDVFKNFFADHSILIPVGHSWDTGSILKLAEKYSDHVRVGNIVIGVSNRTHNLK